MRLAVVAVATAVALAGCGGEKERKHATPEQARAACEAFEQPATRDRNEILERHAKPLLDTEYDDLGTELVRFVTVTRRFEGNASGGDVDLDDVEKIKTSVRRIEERCTALGVVFPPDEG